VAWERRIVVGWRRSRLLLGSGSDADAGDTDAGDTGAGAATGAGDQTGDPASAAEAAEEGNTD
jgi:hypothetical protein